METVFFGPVALETIKFYSNSLDRMTHKYSFECVRLSDKPMPDSGETRQYNYHIIIVV